MHTYVFSINVTVFLNITGKNNSQEKYEMALYLPHDTSDLWN